MFFEQLTLRPVTESFDRARIEMYLASLPFVAANPAIEHSHLIARSADHLAVALEAFRERGRHSYSVAIVTIFADRVEVAQQLDFDTLRNVRTIVQWMLDTFSCRVFDAAGNELSAMTARNAAKLYPDEL
jgi:hypothetical protein